MRRVTERVRSQRHGTSKRLGGASPPESLGSGFPVCRLQEKCKRAHLHGTCDSAVGLSVRDGTCAVQLHRLQSRLATPQSQPIVLPQYSGSSPPSAIRTACDAQRSGFPKRWYGATRPALSHSAAHGAAQCSAAIGATANEHSTQAASCSRQRATGIMQRTTSSTKHPADNTHRRQTREDSVQRTTCSGNDAGDVRRPTACSRHHAAYSTQRTTCSIDAQQTTCSRQRVADNAQQTTCSRQHAADSVQRTTCSRQRVTDTMLQTTCCRNHGMHDAHQTKWPRRTASMH